MKARIKKTGELVNIAPYAKITLESYNSWGDPIEVSPEEIELVHNDVKTDNIPKHWQDVRERAAIAAMQSYLSFGNTYKYITPEGCADNAIRYADALVEKLKEE